MYDPFLSQKTVSLFDHNSFAIMKKIFACFFLFAVLIAKARSIGCKTLGTDTVVAIPNRFCLSQEWHSFIVV